MIKLRYNYKLYIILEGSRERAVTVSLGKKEMGNDF